VVGVWEVEVEEARKSTSTSASSRRPRPHVTISSYLITLLARESIYAPKIPKRFYEICLSLFPSSFAFNIQNLSFKITL